MIFNTNTPYTSSFGTAPVTLSSGIVYIKAFNALNDGSANYDTPIFMESSNASSTGFGLQMNNATNATSTNSAYFGTTTTNDLVLMTANTRRVTITSAGGPFVLTNLSGWFVGNVHVTNGLWNTSDRRLKEDIKSINMDMERYKLLNPVSYRYKNDFKTKLEFIAQEMLQVCEEAVSMTLNEDLKAEQDDDIEGVQLGMDFNTITVLKVDIIKKLINRIEKLESTIEKKN
ncbi:unnamed protein product [Phytophthora lilii]|uniref:Unnamed protein product n=1 Tax=Phytophthora lilii TaxID=2077276 RepID=A0A9W6X9G2_9STRA|nr:unnamed protein product [Phytophthora lilii]